MYLTQLQLKAQYVYFDENKLNFMNQFHHFFVKYKEYYSQSGKELLLFICV